LLGAGNAQQRSRVEVETLLMYRVPASLAQTVFAAINARQCSGNFSQHGRTPHSRRYRHCLRLHCVHTRQSPDPRLVQLDDL
jgi:hypothetical protein